MIASKSTRFRLRLRITMVFHKGTSGQFVVFDHDGSAGK